MSSEKYSTVIKYHVNENRFEVISDLNQRGQQEIIEGHLRCQVGQGASNRNYEKRDTYDISLQWFPEDDTVRVNSNTGNKSLRDGILMDFLGRLEKGLIED